MLLTSIWVMHIVITQRGLLYMGYCIILSTQMLMKKKFKLKLVYNSGVCVIYTLKFPLLIV